MKISEKARMKMALLLIDEAAANASAFGKSERERTNAGSIYRLAHAASMPLCRKNHPDWIKPIDAAIRASRPTRKGGPRK